MTDMKLIRAFRDWATVLKHLVGGESASSFDVKSVHPEHVPQAAPPPLPPKQDGWHLRRKLDLIVLK